MSQHQLRVFNNSNVVAQGWYWALPSRDLPLSGIKTIDLFGKTAVFSRTESGSIQLIAEHTYRTEEKYGMIWIHTNPEVNDPFPSFAELENRKIRVLVDKVELRKCHPTLILGGGVDEEHFLFVHKKTTQTSGPLRFEFKRLSPGVIEFCNVSTILRHSWKGKFLHFLYSGILAYKVTYWNASTALAELGPRFLPLYSIFAYRPTATGETVGLNIYLAPEAAGPFSFLANMRLKMTQMILRGGGSEDAKIQNSIRFRCGPYSLLNKPFAAFVNYVEEQPHFNLRKNEFH
jgi:hypothetical protein